MTPKEKKVSVEVSPPWVELIKFCDSEFPNGELKVKIVNSLPTDLLEAKRKIRFDKPNSIPQKHSEI